MHPKQILNNADPGRLKKFILDYAGKHPQFMEELVAGLREKKPGNKEMYATAIKESFKKNKYYQAGNHYDYADSGFDAFAVAKDLQRLLDKADHFIKQKNYGEAALICCTLIETIPGGWDAGVDEDGDVEMIYGSAIEKLQEMLKRKLLPAAKKGALFNWYLEAGKDDRHREIGLDTDLQSLEKFFSDTPEMLQRSLKNIDERIAKAKEAYQKQSAIRDKIDLLQNAGLGKEVEAVITKHMALPAIRKLRVQQLIKKKHYGEAIALINEGIAIAERRRDTGTAVSWKETLLDIYLLQKDTARIITTAEELFYKGRNALKYYQLLKKYTEKEKWPPYLEGLLGRYKSSGTNHVLAHIYIKEQYWERLLQMVSKSGLDDLEDYGKQLKPHFPVEIRDLYIKLITKFAKDNMGRDHYEYIARTLKKIRTYPGGKDAVDKVLAGFREKYRMRRAMMKELKRL